MERHDDYTILDESNKVDILFLQSARFKLLLFGTLLLVYGIVFSVLFARISIASSNSMQAVISEQMGCYAGQASLDTMQLNFENYLNLNNEDYLNRYEESKSELLRYIELLKNKNFSVYSHDLARVCEKYIQTTDFTISCRWVSSVDLLENAYKDSVRTRGLISIFSVYSVSEIESITNARLFALHNDLFFQLQITIVILSAVTLLIIVVATLFVRRFLSPLHRLTGLVRSVSVEPWEIQTPPISSKDEMGLLVHAFYEMLNKSRRQYDHLLLKQQLEKELQEERERGVRAEALLAKSQLQVFQSQINSHFLFNTLNTVSRLAYIEQAPRTQDATNLVSQFLRVTLNQFNRIIPLAEEFENVENYIKIQKLRFGERIRYEGAMEVELEWFELPVMTIQPLVENALRHGLSGKDSGFIKYAAEKEENSVLIYVWDDGQGVSSQRQNEILRCLHEDDERKVLDCIGLLNVYRRLKLCYPGKVMPVIESLPNAFSKFGFRIIL